MVKKSLNPKKEIFQKIDGAFHNLFFDRGINFSDVSLEIVVEENIRRTYHDISTRGNYLKQRRSTAFKRIQDKIYWKQGLSLTDDYAAQIAKNVDSRVYTIRREDNRLLVKAKVSREEIRKTINDYIKELGGHLNQSQFMELTGASEAQLVKLFGPEHDTISKRLYSTNDALRFSKRFFKELIPKAVGRRTFWKTKDNYETNIIGIYRKILDYNSPKPQQGQLFDQNQ